MQMFKAGDVVIRRNTGGRATVEGTVTRVTNLPMDDSAGSRQRVRVLWESAGRFGPQEQSLSGAQLRLVRAAAKRFTGRNARANAAKAYSKATGRYVGRVGGWVYRSVNGTEYPIVQGWDALGQRLLGSRGPLVQNEDGSYSIREIAR